MQKVLPGFNVKSSGIEFSQWFFVGVPKKLSLIAQRILQHLNNEFSFSLNLRLLFTPLFGDYTWVGRGMGLVYRLGKMALSIPFFIITASMIFLLPILWYVFPLALIYYIKLWFIPFFIFVFLAWELLRPNKASKKVSEVDENNLFDAFRQSTLEYLEDISTQGGVGLLKLVHEPHILKLTQLLELSDKNFLDTLVQNYKPADYLDLVKRAYKYAVEHEARYVEDEHLFLSVVANTPNIDTFLGQFQSQLSYFEGAVRWIVSQREEKDTRYIWQDDYKVPKMGGIDRGLTGRVTPYLDSHSHDLTQFAMSKQFKKPIGKDKVIDQVVSILGGASEKNVMIIGEPGSGKTSVVKALAHEIVYGTKKDALRFKRIVSLDTGLIMAGSKSFGQVAETVTKIMEDVEGSGGIILFIDEIHNLLVSSDSGGEGIAGIFSVLEPYISSGSNQFIAATSVQEYRKYIEPIGAFSRLFEVVELPPASPEVTLKILEDEAVSLERDYNLTISYPALVKTVELSKKLIHERVFPDKALDVLKRTCASLTKKQTFITAEDIAAAISDITHVPVSAVTQDEYIKLINIEDDMRSMVIGQEPALKAIAAALKRARVGIRDENKPIASFLFVGTTGVGKTQTAKALAKNYFGDEKSMIRLDMSEYQHPDSIKTLLGSSDGRTEGYLTSKVRTYPFALVLLDEIEKAHSNILLTFLQVLDDGRLTDASGRTVDFTNTIIIATSNVGTREIQEIAKAGGLFTDMEKVAMNAVRNNFAPEFLNRFNGIIVFKPLNKEKMRKIADLLLERVRKMSEKNNIKIEFTPELVDALAEKGYDPEYGARPLTRIIEQYVETYLADSILRGQINNGDHVKLGLEVLMTETGELKFDSHDIAQEDKNTFAESQDLSSILPPELPDQPQNFE